MLNISDPLIEPHALRTPFKQAMNVATDDYDITAGGSADTLDVFAYLPDNIVYKLDDILLCTTTAVVVGDGTIKIGVIAPNGRPDDDSAISDDEYLLAYTAPISAIGVEVSVSDGDLSWPATANTDAERTIIGPVIITVTTTLATGAGALAVAMRSHATDSDKYPMVAESKHGNSIP